MCYDVKEPYHQTNSNTPREITARGALSVRIHVRSVRMRNRTVEVRGWYLGFLFLGQKLTLYITAACVTLFHQDLWKETKLHCHYLMYELPVSCAQVRRLNFECRGRSSLKPKHSTPEHSILYEKQKALVNVTTEGR